MKKRTSVICLLATFAIVAVAANVFASKPASDVSPSMVWKAANYQNPSQRKAFARYFSQVIVGKTEQEVLDLLGEPSRRGYGVCGIVQGEHELLTYSMRDWQEQHLYEVFVVRLKNGRVVKADVELGVCAINNPVQANRA